MEPSVTINQYRGYTKFVVDWNCCTHFGTISSRVDRTNDVPNHLAKLRVTNLIPYLLIKEITNAFVYEADLGRKNLLHIVEIYHDVRLRGTEWRERNAQIALRLDVDLIDGLDDNVVVTDFVVPFAQTALEEAILNN